MKTYKAELDQIPMRYFIALVEGHPECKFDIPEKEARLKLQKEYTEIVGGKRIAAEINKEDGKLNIELTERCLVAAWNLVQLHKKDRALEILAKIGYTYPANETAEQTSKRIENAMRMNQLKMARIEAANKATEEKPDENGQSTARNRFIEERVAMMQHYKMHIDIDKLSAAEYAYMVKRMVDDLERENASRKKMMAKRK